MIKFTARQQQILQLISGFRPACVLLIWIMAMAMTFHLGRGDGFAVYSHALQLGITFLGLLFVGPGKLSVDRQ